MDLSIIIVNWNTREFLARCLDSVYETVSGIRFEVLVVDNASTDDSVRIVRRQFPHAHLIENRENAGFARANNQAIRLSRGRYILLLNSDTEVQAGALAKMVGFMADHPQVGGCGPRLFNADGSLQVSCHPMLTPWREFWRLLFLERISRRTTYDLSGWDLQTPREVEVIKGACLMLRRQALDQVGLLDEQYFMYTEEVDLCFRLRQAGWKLYWLPEARVVHYGEGSSRQVAEMMYIQLYRSKIQFYRKIGGEARVRLFKILLTLAYLPRLLVSVISALFVPARAVQAHLYRRLLAELPNM